MTEHDDEEYDMRIADDLDRASAIERHGTDTTVSHIRSKCKPAQLARDDGSFEFTDCEDCGNEIGDGRLRVAIQNNLCVHCASRNEILNKRKNP